MSWAGTEQECYGRQILHATHIVNWKLFTIEEYIACIYLLICMVSELVHAIKLFFKSYEFLLTCSSKLSRVSQMAVMGYEKGREKTFLQGQEKMEFSLWVREISTLKKSKGKVIFLLNDYNRFYSFIFVKLVSLTLLMYIVYNSW